LGRSFRRVREEGRIPHLGGWTEKKRRLWQAQGEKEKTVRVYSRKKKKKSRPFNLGKEKKGNKDEGQGRGMSR